MKIKTRNVKWANSNPQVHVFKNQDQKIFFLNAYSICPYFQQFYMWCWELRITSIIILKSKMRVLSRSVMTFDRII